MHFHLPKPMHGWRAFVGEVGIIVVGVLIALAAEQVVESWHWRSKVASMKQDVDFEVNDQLDYSEEEMSFSSCTGRYVDALEAAILRHDSGTIGKLHDIRPPFEPRPWRTTAWQSAMSTQVADHLPAAELAQYSVLFSSFEDIRRAQGEVFNDFAEATTGRLGAPADPTATQLQLAAAERLRTQLNLESTIAGSTIYVAAGAKPELGWKPIGRVRWARLRPIIQQQGALCERTVRALTSTPAGTH